jgi:hypothetical protein
VNSLPKNLATLAAIVAFCSALLIALLCDCPPLAALRKAALGGAAAAVVTWFCARVALAVLVEGIRQQASQEGE